MRGLALLLPLLIGAACSRREVTAGLLVEPLEIAFLVTADEGARVRRASPPFGVDAGGVLAFGAPPSFELEEGEAGAFVIGLSRAALGADPRVRIGEIEQAALFPGAPGAGNDEIVEVEIPREARVFALAGSELSPAPGPTAATLLSSAALRLPADGEPCRVPAQPALSPLGATTSVWSALPLSGDPQADRDNNNVIRVARIDDAHVLAVTHLALYVVERGSSAPLAAVPTSDFAGAHPAAARAPYLYRAAVGPSIDGRREVLLLGSDTALGMQIWRASAGADGIGRVEGATVAPSGWPSSAFTDAAYDGAGNVVAVTLGGERMVRRRGSEVFELAPLLGNPARFTRVVGTGVAAAPHAIAGDDGQLFVGDAITGTFEALRFGQGDPPHVTALGIDERGEELWIATRERRLFRGPLRGPFGPVLLSPPPRLMRCVSAEQDGEVGIAGVLLELAVAGGEVLVLGAGCSAVPRIRRSDLCVTLIPRGEEPIGPASDRINTTLDRTGDLLTVGGTDGALYEARISPR